MDNNSSFHYTYSPQQQEEIQAIRRKYLPPEEDKMEKLRSLHHCATQKAQAASISLGVIGTLLLGFGMSLILTDLGPMLGILYPMALGCLTGFAGLILVALAYPVYRQVLKKQRAKIAPEILRLTEELLQ